MLRRSLIQKSKADRSVVEVIASKGEMVAAFRLNCASVDDGMMAISMETKEELDWDMNIPFRICTLSTSSGGGKPTVEL